MWLLWRKTVAATGWGKQAWHFTAGSRPPWSCKALPGLCKSPLNAYLIVLWDYICWQFVCCFCFFVLRHHRGFSQKTWDSGNLLSSSPPLPAEALQRRPLQPRPVLKGLGIRRVENYCLRENPGHLPACLLARGPAPPLWIKPYSLMCPSRREARSV